MAAKVATASALSASGRMPGPLIRAVGGSGWASGGGGRVFTESSTQQADGIMALVWPGSFCVDFNMARQNRLAADCGEMDGCVRRFCHFAIKKTPDPFTPSRPLYSF